MWELGEEENARVCGGWALLCAGGIWLVFGRGKEKRINLLLDFTIG